MSALQVPVSSSDHTLGPADAAVVLVEYGDYQCPYCGVAHGVVQQIRHELGDRVRVVFRNYPLMDAHPQALPAAMVAEYAGQHGKFWQAHDALYDNQQQLGPAFYSQLLQTLQVPLQGLEDALQNNSFGARIRQDMQSGERSGVDGTPAFFLNGQRFHIQQSYDELFAQVARLARAPR